MISASEEFLATVLRNFRGRLQMILDTDGENIENGFT
jgi:hypothetical protein